MMSSSMTIRPKPFVSNKSTTMDCKIPVDLSMSYLRAIQKIPGDTAGEKFSWIGRLALHQASEDIEQFPPELLSLLHVETAVKKKRHKDNVSAEM
ncbi:PREDICTED: uncharacterized protein LOC105147524 [Acromyrmex echinatior]|uniref:uncharacterized protein LOC105147524 n=1 Tax=Acromyrmex echinatior TaxID=103372 RepID=UPI000580CC78|nr:PREDICTED: uncharacterized protein LOC105147524 [Acromyrmex echinatior]